MPTIDEISSTTDPLHKVRGALAFLESAHRLNSADIAEWSGDVGTAITVLRSGLESAESAIREARAEERERCIQACIPWTTANHVYVNGALRCVDAIRALKD